MSYLRYLCLFTYSGVQHILCFCFVYLRLVCPVLPGSLECPFFITPSVSLTFIATHKKIICLSLWQTNRRIEQIYKDFG